MAEPMTMKKLMTIVTKDVEESKTMARNDPA